MQQCSQDDHAARDQLRIALDETVNADGVPPEFTISDLHDVIARLSDTCGPNRLRLSGFRALSDPEQWAFLAEINNSVTTGLILTHWTDGFLVPITKPRKDHRTLQGYRVITVQNMGGKLVEGL